jgi:hypothetical protein
MRGRVTDTTAHSLHIRSFFLINTIDFVFLSLAVVTREKYDSQRVAKPFLFFSVDRFLIFPSRLSKKSERRLFIPGTCFDWLFRSSKSGVVEFPTSGQNLLYFSPLTDA